MRSDVARVRSLNFILKARENNGFKTSSEIIFSTKTCTEKYLFNLVTRSNMAKAAAWGGVQVKLAENQLCLRQKHRKQL